MISNPFSILMTSMLACVLLLATVEDCKTGKIPNSITLPSMGLGFILLCGYCVTERSAKPLLYAAIALIGLFLFGMFRLIGIGDIKLLMVCVLLSGPFSMLITMGGGSLLVILFAIIRNPKHGIQALLTGLQTIQSKSINRDVLHASDRIPFVPFLCAAWVILTIIKFITGIALWI